MKVWIQKPEKENETALVAVEHKGMTAFADLGLLAHGALGAVLALALPGLFRRAGAGRGRAARRASGRNGTFRGKGAFGRRGRR